MASNSPSSGSTQPLRVGDVVGTAFRLYGAKLDDYIKLALLATLWISLPLVVSIATIGLFFSDSNSNLDLLGPVLIALFVYPAAQYSVNLAMISRLAFGELINRPESIQMARRFVQQRMWNLFLSGLLVGVLCISAFFVLSVAAGIILLIFMVPLGMGMAVGGIASNLGLIALLVMLAVLAVCWLGFLWLWARFSFYEVPLAIEPDATAKSAIDRSWSLSKGNVWRIVLILLIASLATLPFALIVLSFASAIWQVTVGSGLQPVNSGTRLLTGPIICLLGAISQVLVLPLWQVIKAVIYRDLRRRREGMDLAPRDRTI